MSVCCVNEIKERSDGGNLVSVCSVNETKDRVKAYWNVDGKD